MPAMKSIAGLNIAIVDYQLGNLFSVKRACEKIGCSPLVTSSPDDIYRADAIILPGVGAFKAAMDNMESTGLKHACIEFVKKGKPLMGVCLGMQLLFDSSEEFEYCNGLGIINGTVKKFAADREKNVKVPQIAWNTISSPTSGNWETSPFSGLKQNEFMYFVHSFYGVPSDANVVLSETIYHNTTYCSSIQADNVFATQFHPEKSGEKGVLIYKNWIEQI